jgi:pimeloyl-ACP methyl ester carboxylesterase
MLPQPADRFVRIGDLRFHFLDSGGDKPVLLFLHGTGLHASVWTPYARRFADRYRFVALDQRGHGETDKPPTGYRWEAFGADLAGFLDVLDLDEVSAVGHSKGATAIAAAAACGTRRLRRAVLIEPILYSGPPASEPVESSLSAGARRRRHEWPSRAAMFESLRARVPFATWEEEFVRAYVDHGVVDRPDGQVELRCPGDIEAQVYANAPRSDGFAFLERLTVPTLILRGAHSEEAAEPRVAEALRRLPRAELVTIANAGHFVPMERSAEVSTAITAFLERG